jgi:hypothetical protein
MQPIITDGCVNYGAPKGWDHEKDGPCNMLPVIKNGDLHLSIWTFSPEERKQIAEGQNLALITVHVQPPVALSIHDIQGPGAWDDTEATPRKSPWWRRLFA